MYSDYPPHKLPPGVNCVVVIEPGDDADEVIRLAREVGATYTSMGGDEIFWVVWPDDPKRAWDYTERALRADIDRKF